MSHPQPEHEPHRQTADVADAVHRSWWSVDADFGIGSELQYTEDGVCHMPALTMRGRSEIAAGYAQRQANGPRLSRHLVSNLVVDQIDHDHARAKYVITLLAGNGLAPLVIRSMSAVCDVEDSYVRAGGGWLIEQRTLRAVFVAADNDSVMLAHEAKA